ncbi:MAG: DNA-3-methyladenine glycosylase family protein, partial [Planctomycetaceae bacterium]
MPRRLVLTPKHTRTALSELAAADADLGRVLDAHGPPPLWVREPGFPTLVQIILEQQVSFKAGQAIFARLRAEIPDFTPPGLLRLGVDDLRGLGLSRQKAAYVRSLAEAIAGGQLDLAALIRKDDDAIRAELTALKGIGRWTVDIYLLMALRRPDVWPGGDLGLVMAVERLKSLSARPTAAQLEAIAEPWRPWRAVAARLLWHFHVQTRSQRGEPRRGVFGAERS